MTQEVWAVVADDMNAASVVGAALQTGAPVRGIVVGSRELADKVASLGVSKVSWFNTETVLAESYASAVSKLAFEAPQALFAADEATARVIVGNVAANLNAPTATLVTSVRLSGEQAAVEHQAAEGAAIKVLTAPVPVACIIADGGAEAEVTSAAEVEEMPVEASDQLVALAVHEEEGGGVSLATADRVVSAGIGVGVKENLALVENLAEALGAESACSLPLCDNYHWYEHGRVVGSSTQKISPRFYLACGVSGQPQHMMGVRGAKTIAAINNDPEALIFREAKFGILGDLKEVLPALTQAVKNA